MANVEITEAASRQAVLDELIGREVLIADRTYYVRTDGSDSNNGLTNNSGGAFLTIQAAVDAAYAVDFNGYTVTISVGAGTYTSGVSFTGRAVGQIAYTDLVLTGATGTATDVVISTTSANAITVGYGAQVSIKDLQVQTTTSGIGVLSFHDAYTNLSNVFFGAATTHIYSAYRATVQVSANYTISGAASAHWRCEGASYLICQSITITLSGTPAFSSYFAAGTDVGILRIGSLTFTGSATGKRYQSDLNSIINTLGGGSTYLPGNSTGTTSTGGQYA